MVTVAIANAGTETGALLVGMLKGRGVYDEDSKNVVCYGISGRGTHHLNKNCTLHKIERMVKMGEAGVSVIPWFPANAAIPAGAFPLLARKTMGHGGTDIVPVFEPKEVPWRVAAGWDWFSSYIPTATEYRVWVYRDNYLDVYEKVMRRPSDYKYIGRNFRNGFDFSLRPEGSNPYDRHHTTTLAIAAVKSLGLDFAAVDILKGEDGRFYILEVNTAPGAIKSGAQITLGKLADCIALWTPSRRDGYHEND